MNEHKYGTVLEWRLTRSDESTGEEPVPLPAYLPHIPHRLLCDDTHVLSFDCG